MSDTEIMESSENWQRITIGEVNVGDVVWLPAESMAADEPHNGVTGTVLGKVDSDSFAYGRGKHKVQTSFVSLLIQKPDNTIVEFTTLIGADRCWRRDERSMSDEQTT